MSESAWSAWPFDATLALALPAIAWRLVAGRTLHEAIVLFVSLGLLTSIAWTRLDAIDVALVEAGLGTGVTGALLVSSLAWAETRVSSGPLPPRRPFTPWTFGLLVVSGALYLAWIVLASGDGRAGLSEQVAAAMARSGVSHPVTAVLLNFRGYDTLLETAVLLVAALGVVSLRRPSYGPARGEALPRSNVLESVVALLVPSGLLIAGYLVWAGSHAPGGAFQAGAVIAGCAVLLLLANRIRAPRLSFPTRALLSMGPALFVALAGAPLLAHESLLEYPPVSGGRSIFVLELALTGSIAVILTMFFPPLETSDGGAP